MPETFVDKWNEMNTSRPKTDMSGEMLQLLKSHGATGISTTKYIYRFAIGDSAVEFADHGMMLSGTINRHPLTDLEKKCLDEADEILESLRYSVVDKLNFVREFGYKRFQYTGQPTDTVPRVIKLSQTPIGVVIAEQHRLGMTGYGIVNESLVLR